ncbi:hypothetical protein I302_107300 [Kwoniella bestiolae CBS 10118]|uniref:Uncharacterized protein n=1 Tax=Kwoniella bestiolae CBS 10118 TaxID=1296100 RepID=A0A1B9FYX3_9TREE|nr:hypothetical protein I302_06964 [Kwoniella bestiolae CBS 10118]OCF23978.1 hypothetical protein I302_06964 [Kwoniella bestiolae CBS 10118]
MLFTPTTTIALLSIPFLTFASAAKYLGIHIQIGEGMAVDSSLLSDDGKKKEPGAGVGFSWLEGNIGDDRYKKYPNFDVYKGDEVAFNMMVSSSHSIKHSTSTACTHVILLSAWLATPLKYNPDGPKSAKYNITSITEGDKVKVRFDVSNADVASLNCTRKVDDTTPVIWTSESAFSAPL